MSDSLTGQAARSRQTSPLETGASGGCCPPGAASVPAKAEPNSAADRSALLPIVEPPPGAKRYPSPVSLIEALLTEQQELTAVEHFAREHEQGDVPAQSRYYAKLLPATSPGPGQQYGFEVDLDRCSGCKACVTACHLMNGLDEHETWRDVGLLVGGTAASPVMQHVTTACHHCLEPACATACPVDAYQKDPVTGIVRHLDDQCFGCQYCTLACPYDVPKYHHGKGIVRKCDMCSSRLAAGEAPACVQACPHEAIAIQLVEADEVRENAEADSFLPAAPEPHLTLPATTYRTRRVFPRNMLPADYHRSSPQHPHWPLIVMLVLTQLSVGAFTAGAVLETLLDRQVLDAIRPVQATGAVVFGLLALAASTLHLGRPQYAFRAVVGLKHSWLSREIVTFGLFAVVAMAYALVCWNVPFIGRSPAETRSLQRLLGWGVVVTGAAGLVCSVMIYAFTRREFWSFERTLIRFVLTAAVLGLAGTWLTVLLVGVSTSDDGPLPADIGFVLGRWLQVAVCLKLAFDLAVLRHLATPRSTPLRQSARLMAGELSNVTLARIACGLLGGLVLPSLAFGSAAASAVDQNAEIVHTIAVAMLFVACMAGELLERYLFFAAVSSPRMPGGLRS